VVCYESQKINEHEKNYVTHEMKLFIVENAFKMWKNYVMGKKIVLMIDYNFLKYLFNYPNLNARKAR
jgi:hypothetical protein